MVRLVHQLRGRARFHVTGLRGSKARAEHLERTLPRFGGIFQASANSITGNVLLFFAPEHSLEAIARIVEKALRGLGSEVAQSLRVDSVSMPQERFRPSTWEATAPDRHGRDLNLRGRFEALPIPWHALTPEAIASRLDTSTERGLGEESVLDRQLKSGLNMLPGSFKRSFSHILKSQILSLPVMLIGAAAGLSAITGNWLEGLLSIGVACVNAAISAVSERRAERIIEVVSEAVDLRAGVLREGRLREIPFSQIVPGDILDLQVGSRVPADARLIQAEHLSVDESALTGESVPVSKYATTLMEETTPITRQVNMVFRGTLVVEGRGRAMVVATGAETVLGKLQAFLGEVLPPEALMVKYMRSVANHLITLGTVACTVFASLSLLRGRALIAVLCDSIAVVARSVPSGLATIALSAFALGHRDMRRNRILVRRLRALGSLADIEVVCFDKTGTLTLNRMTPTQLCVGARHIKIDDHGFTAGERSIDPLRDPDLLWLVKLAALCNTTEVFEEGGQRSIEGSSTEKALIDLAERAGIDTAAFRSRHFIEEIEHRTHKRHFMETLHHWGETRKLLAVKGTPTEVLERCTHYRRGGRRFPLGEEERQSIESNNLRMAGTGLRVLGLAYRWEVRTGRLDAFPQDRGLVWCGLVALADPVREGAQALIEGLHKAGIKTAVITGDQSPTAYHIGERLRLSGDQPLRILDSTDLGALSTGGMRTVVTQAHVFARLSPTQKLQIIQAYQSTGKSVMMVGDGFNDALAIRVSDVGVAMGREGADLARSSADLVLEEDELPSLLVAIASGRAFYENVRKSLRFLLTANHVDLMVELAQTAGTLQHSQSVLKELWENLACLSLALDPSTNPRPRAVWEGEHGASLSAEAKGHSLVDAGALLAGACAAGASTFLKPGGGLDGNELFLRSASINQLLYAMQCRRPEKGGLAELPPNPLLNVVLTGMVGGYFLTTLLRGAAGILDCAALAAGIYISNSLLGRFTRDNPLRGLFLQTSDAVAGAAP